MKKLLLVLLALVLVLSSGCAKSDPQRPQLTDEEWESVFEYTEMILDNPLSAEEFSSFSVSLEDDHIFMCYISTDYNALYNLATNEASSLSPKVSEEIAELEESDRETFMGCIRNINLMSELYDERYVTTEENDFLDGVLDYYDAVFLACPYDADGSMGNPIYELRLDHETKDITTEYTILSGEEWIE